MQYDLARKLLARPAGSPDINPEGLALVDYEKLDLNADDWELVIELESDGKRRPEVLRLAQEKINIPLGEPVTQVDNILRVDFDAFSIVDDSIEHLRNLDLTREQWALVLEAELSGKNRIGAIEFIEAKLE